MKLHPSLFELSRERCRLGGCRGACCVNGIWVDVGHVQTILAAVETIRPFVAEPYRDRDDQWFGDEEWAHADFPSGLAIPTTVAPRVDGSGRDGCVFLRHDHTCALEVASAAHGQGWPGWKPFDCANYPVLRSEGEVRIDHQSPSQLDGADCTRGGAAKRPAFAVFRREVELSIGRAGWLACRRRWRASQTSG